MTESRQAWSACSGCSRPGRLLLLAVAAGTLAVGGRAAARDEAAGQGEQQQTQAASRAEVGPAAVHGAGTPDDGPAAARAGNERTAARAGSEQPTAGAEGEATRSVGELGGAQQLEASRSQDLLPPVAGPPAELLQMDRLLDALAVAESRREQALSETLRGAIWIGVSLLGAGAATVAAADDSVSVPLSLTWLSGALGGVALGGHIVLRGRAGYGAAEEELRRLDRQLSIVGGAAAEAQGAPGLP